MCCWVEITAWHFLCNDVSVDFASVLQLCMPAVLPRRVRILEEGWDLMDFCAPNSKHCNTLSFSQQHFKEPLGVHWWKVAVSPAVTGIGRLSRMSPHKVQWSCERILMACKMVMGIAPGGSGGGSGGGQAKNTTVLFKYISLQLWNFFFFWWVICNLIFLCLLFTVVVVMIRSSVSAVSFFSLAEFMSLCLWAVLCSKKQRVFMRSTESDWTIVQCSSSWIDEACVWPAPFGSTDSPGVTSATIAPVLRLYKFSENWQVKSF